MSSYCSFVGELQAASVCGNRSKAFLRSNALPTGIANHIYGQHTPMISNYGGMSRTFPLVMHVFRKAITFGRCPHFTKSHLIHRS